MKMQCCITRIVNLDCASNIFISIEVLLLNLEVGFPLKISAICAVRNATVLSLTLFTRLVPVAIVLLRYIMVCQPAFYTNCGKEKGIWKWILGSVIVLCSAFWIYHIYTSVITSRFLCCMRKQAKRIWVYFLISPD